MISPTNTAPSYGTWMMFLMGVLAIVALVLHLSVEVIGLLFSIFWLLCAISIGSWATRLVRLLLGMSQRTGSPLPTQHPGLR